MFDQCCLTSSQYLLVQRNRNSWGKIINKYYLDEQFYCQYVLVFDGENSVFEMKVSENFEWLHKRVQLKIIGSNNNSITKRTCKISFSSFDKKKKKQKSRYVLSKLYICLCLSTVLSYYLLYSAVPIKT